MKRNQAMKADESPKDGWTYHGVPAIRELLDHVAKELAEEYVRLMKNDPGTPKAGSRRRLKK